MIHIFCGYDAREEVGFHVFSRSLLSRTSRQVRITPIGSFGGKEGSNAFTYSRFLVPAMMGYSGHAIFVDGSDMLMQADIAELDALFDPRFAVQVVKHPIYKTLHKVKYICTSMECPNLNYERKNWASVMIVNCAHDAWKRVPEGLDALQLRFIPDELIGELPPEWNRLVDEGQPTDGKVLHWTGGVPAFKHYANAPCADLWHAERAMMLDAA
jgi:hypothetical protein